MIYGTSPGGVVERDTAKAPIAATPAIPLPPNVKSVVVVETPAGQVLHHEMPAQPAMLPNAAAAKAAFTGSASVTQLSELWEQQNKAALLNLDPEGALTGATRELQAGLGAFLQVCLEHGVKVGPWRLQHVVGEWTFGEHPTYGAISIGHWTCKDGQPWKVGVGLFLGRGPAKPKDLAIKLSAFEAEPPVLDHLILLRPEEDLALSGKSKILWQETERRGRHARVEAVSLESFAVLYAFPRWMAALTEALPAGQPLPNLADMLQERCEKLLQQVCMPIQGG
jgi:hypothetical protein